MPLVTSNRVTGYPPLPLGETRTPNYSLKRTLRIRQTYGLDFSTAASTSPLRPLLSYPEGHFHEFSRASGPKGQT